MMPIISVVGKSNSGKTTLLEKLIPEMKNRGYRVGTIKHDVHNFEIDHEGKDTWRHTQAGADTVAIASSSKLALFKKTDGEKPLDELAMAFFGDVDIILTEGFKRSDKPKIEVFRQELHPEPLCTRNDNLIAIVSDTEIDVGVPCYSSGEVRALADFLEKCFLSADTRQDRKEVLRNKTLREPAVC